MMIKPKVPLRLELSDATERMTVEEIVESGTLGEVYLIDFGLSFVSGKIEDKAVDIYVLKRAFISTHPGSEQLFDRILDKYREKAGGAQGLKIIAKYKDVEKRGRKRECFG
jgi:TP53 regulating kinase-like protein